MDVQGLQLQLQPVVIMRWRVFSVEGNMGTKSHGWLVVGGEGSTYGLRSTPL